MSDSTKVEWWEEQRAWLLARIPTQTNPETVEELRGALAVAEARIAAIQAESYLHLRRVGEPG